MKEGALFLLLFLSVSLISHSRGAQRKTHAGNAEEREGENSGKNKTLARSTKERERKEEKKKSALAVTTRSFFFQEKSVSIMPPFGKEFGTFQ